MKERAALMNLEELPPTSPGRPSDRWEGAVNELEPPKVVPGGGRRRRAGQLWSLGVQVSSDGAARRSAKASCRGGRCGVRGLESRAPMAGNSARRSERASGR